MVLQGEEGGARDSFLFFNLLVGSPHVGRNLLVRARTSRVGAHQLLVAHPQLV